MPRATLMRRLLSLAYEVVVLGALLMLAALPFVILTRDAEHAAARPLFQFYLVLVSGAYFVWQWHRGGQTLPMRTWRLRLVRRDGGRLSLERALLRYCFALAGTFLCGAGFAWALVDPDRQFLHDRVTGTVIITDEGGRIKDE